MVVRAEQKTESKTGGQLSEVAGQAKGKLNQLLGIRGASESSDIWKIRLQLTKPVTWVPLIWGEHLNQEYKAKYIACQSHSQQGNPCRRAVRCGSLRAV